MSEGSALGLFFLNSAKAFSAAAFTWVQNHHTCDDRDEGTNLVCVSLFNRIPQETLAAFPTTRGGVRSGLIKMIITIDNLPTDIARESATMWAGHLVALYEKEFSWP